MPKAAARSTSSNHILRYEFPYVRFHGKTYPLIPVTVSKGRYSVNTFGLLDSGASISVFRPEIAKALRIPIRKRQSIRLATGSGGVDIDISKVGLRIRRTSFVTKIGFSSTYKPAFNIIGREGFFHRFSVCFNEMMKTVVMVPLKGLR